VSEINPFPYFPEEGHLKTYTHNLVGYNKTISLQYPKGYIHTYENIIL